MTGGIIFAALLLGGIQLYLGQERLLAGILLSGASIAVIRLLLNGRRRNGR
jgi:hypothetical protein